MKWSALSIVCWLVLGMLFVVGKANLPAFVFWVLVVGWVTGWWFIFKKFKHKAYFFGFLIGLVALLWFTLQLSFVQNFLVKTVVANLSSSLKTEIQLKRIDFRFFDKMEMEGLLVRDLHKDTLLYAGSVRVNITDWFFVKDKPVLKYISLSNAVINFNRSDSNWNYKFLADYFGSSNKDKKKEKGGIQFDLKIVQLDNIRFNQVDGWSGKDQSIALKRLDLFADDLNFDKKKLRINSINIDGPQFTQKDYDGLRKQLGLDVIQTPLASSSAYRWNNDDLVIEVGNLKITNGQFILNKVNNDPPVDHFDGNHLLFSQINVTMNGLKFEHDTLSTQMNLSAFEKSGLHVKQLKAKVKFTPEIMEFAELDLVTNRSHLGPYYSMGYEDFNEDMSEFLTHIKLKGVFENSELDSDDLVFFAPDTKNWKRVFQINGQVSGTISNLSGKKMLVKSGSSSFDGNVTLKGLPDIEQTFIDLKSNDLQTNYADLCYVVPSLKTLQQPNLARLGNIRYQGNFTGFINDFVTYGTIQTQLGTVVSDLNLKLPKIGAAQYVGKLSTEGFQLGSFINAPEIGRIAFNGKVNGSGFSTASMKAYFDGNVRNIAVNGYDFQNIIIKGDFTSNKFQGQTSINDPNLQLTDLHGSIDFSEKVPIFDFDASLAKADLKKLGVTKDELDIGGLFSFHFTGDNIDHFLGTASLRNALVVHNGNLLSLDSVLLQSTMVDNIKNLSLQSNQVDAAVTGTFNLRELPDAFRLFLNRYYPAYIQKPTFNISNQDFSFKVNTRDISGYLPLIDPKLGGLNDVNLTGRLELDKNQLEVKANVPFFIYDQRTFNNIRINGQGTLDTLIARVDVDDITLNDSLHLPAANLLVTAHNNISDISLKTSASKTLSDASVFAQVQTLNDGVNIRFFPSSFMINDKKWQLEKNGELLLRKSIVNASDIRFVQGNQEISIATQPNSDGQSNTNDIVVRLKQVNVDDFTPLFFKQPQMEGQVTGTVTITDPFGKSYIDYDTRIEQFRFEKDSIGVVTAKGNYNSKTGIAKFKASSLENESNHFSFEGSYNSKDSSSQQLDVQFVSKQLDLSILNTYLGGLFSNIQGKANTSDFRVYGDPSRPTITGTANIMDAELTVNFTKCRYKMSNETIIFNPGEIDFGSVIFSDNLKNTGTLTGRLRHHFFHDLEYDDIKLQSPKLLVLNTTKKDNKQFYGKVIGQANMSLTGDENNLFIKINGEPSRVDTSHIFIVGGNTVESGVLDYIDFIQFGTEMESRYNGKASSNFFLDMDLVANPSCKIDVVLDEITGDVIKGTGEGRLNITVGTKEELKIKGTYNITAGDYTFNFQTVLQKYFTVNSGTVTWDGDPYKANINIWAEYLAKNVDFSSLSNGTSSSISSNTFKQKSDVKIQAHLTETLLKPAIDFKFEVPPTSPFKGDFFVAKRLQQFEDDRNEMNKQITSLLLFGSFINSNSDQGLINTTSGYNLISGTIGGVVSNAISGFFNNLLFKNSNTSLYVDVNSSFGNNSTDLKNSVAQLQAAAKTGVIIKILKGKIVITAGVNVDINNPYIITNKNVFLTPDIAAEFILSQDGKFRIVAFNKTNYDLVGQRNRTGAQLSYRKEFNKLSELFQKNAVKP